MKNFFLQKMNAKKYEQVLINYKKNFSKKFIIKNYGLFLGSKSLFKILKCFEILIEIKQKKIKGDIIEFGTWNGNNLLMIKKMVDYLGLKKKVFGFDNFKGMPNADNKNFFKGDKKLILYIKSFFNLENIKIFEDDIMNLSKHKKKFGKLSFVYIDCDLYSTTKKILEICENKVSKGGFIVFDEGSFNTKGGEGKAAKEFFYKNSKKFTKKRINKYFQPDLIFIKR